MIPLSGQTLRRLHALFAAGECEAAEQLLIERCGDALPLTGSADENFWERIRFAVLKLSAGDLQKLKHETDRANCDWRDTLVAAGFGQSTTVHQSWFPRTDQREGKS